MSSKSPLDQHKFLPVVVLHSHSSHLQHSIYIGDCKIVNSLLVVHKSLPGGKGIVTYWITLQPITSMSGDNRYPFGGGMTWPNGLCYIRTPFLQCTFFTKGIILSKLFAAVRIWWMNGVLCLTNCEKGKNAEWVFICASNGSDGMANTLHVSAEATCE